MLPQVQPGQSVAEAAAGGVGGGLPPPCRNDPRVLKAKQAGYSDEEIMQYLGEGNEASPLDEIFGTECYTEYFTS